MKLVYVAEPIDQASGIRRAEALGRLARIYGFTAFLPSGAFAASGEPDPRVEQINRAALERADALVAFLPAGVPSIGVPREIEAFAATGRPWAVCTDVRSYSTLDAHATFELNDASAPAQWVRDLPEPTGPPTLGVAPLRFTKDSEYDGTLPTRAYDGDAGYDLYAADDIHVPYDSFRDVPCGVRVALPVGYYGRIVGRSSTLRGRNLLVNEGIIDTGWRGPLFAGVRNLGQGPAVIHRGERIAQLILQPNIAPQYRPEWLSSADFAAIPHDGRGTSGFGSTGR